MIFKECWEYFKSKVNAKALAYTIGFAVYAVLLTYVFKYQSHFLASYILILTIISGILYTLLAKCYQPVSPAHEILNLKELNGVSKVSPKGDTFQHN